MPDEAGLEHILETLGREERRALWAKYKDGGIAALRYELVFVVARLSEREAAEEIKRVAFKLGGQAKLLRKYGTIYRSDIHNLQNAPTVYSDEMLAGNVIPESIYPTLTGKRPTVYVKGVAVDFVLAVLHELGIQQYTAAGVVKAMQRYGVPERNRRLTAEQKNTPSRSKETSRTTRTKNRVCPRLSADKSDADKRTTLKISWLKERVAYLSNADKTLLQRGVYALCRVCPSASLS